MIKEYTIKSRSGSILVDADWNKPAWQQVESILINLPHWPCQSEHLPVTEVKMQYDPENIYVIFRVKDRHVRAVATGINGQVWKDSCVEFFFSPYPCKGDSYLNLEVNCTGIPLMQHHDAPRTGTRFIDVEQCRKIEIAASIQTNVENEITEPLTWTLEYRLPFEILEAYPEFVRPARGICWKANFYKCADDSSHPHWMTWSPIDRRQPDFHRPEYFGILKFAAP